MAIPAQCDCDQSGNFDLACHASDCAWRQAGGSLSSQEAQSIVAGYEQRLALIHWWSRPRRGDEADWQAQDKHPDAVALGRKGGLAGKGKTSKAKAKAARQNGKKGGRPRASRFLAEEDVPCADCGRASGHEPSCIGELARYLDRDDTEGEGK